MSQQRRDCADMRQPRAAPVLVHLKIASVIIGSIFGALRSLCIDRLTAALSARLINSLNSMKCISTCYHFYIYVAAERERWAALISRCGGTFWANFSVLSLSLGKLKKPRRMHARWRRGGAESTLNGLIRSLSKSLSTGDSEEYETFSRRLVSQFSKQKSDIVDVGVRCWCYDSLHRPNIIERA